MSRVSLLAGLLVLWAGSATAQVSTNNLTAKLAACRLVKSDLQRLACYDALTETNMPGNSGSAASGSETGKWQLDHEINPLDDTNTSYAALSSDEGTTRLGEPIVVVLRCQSHQTEAYVAWGEYLGDSPSVTYRIGAAPSRTQTWAESSDNTATFIPKPEGFIKDLLTAKRLVVQVTPYDEDPITAVFDLTGIKRAVAPIRTSCGW